MDSTHYIKLIEYFSLMVMSFIPMVSAMIVFRGPILSGMRGDDNIWQRRESWDVVNLIGIVFSLSVYLFQWLIGSFYGLDNTSTGDLVFLGIFALGGIMKVTGPLIKAFMDKHVNK
jgi:hypothetical protein